jgi:predicted ribosomally synthesized peptide with SipW-like signal peptide
MRDFKKILLSLGAVAGIAAVATGGTFAVFTDTESIANNDFDSGSVEIELNDGATGAVISVSDLVIGDSKTGTLKVENVGDNKATFTLSGDATGSDDLEDAVHITINDGTTDVVDDVALSTFNDGAGLNVGALSPGASKTFTIDVSLPTTGTDAGDNLLQNLEGEETFDVDAVQRAGIDRDTDSTPEAND